MENLLAKIQGLWTTHSQTILEMENEASNRWARINEIDNQLWIWRAYAESMATNGGASHLDRLSFLRSFIVERVGFDFFSFENLCSCSDSERESWMELIANPHYQRHGALVENLRSFLRRQSQDIQRLQEQIIHGTRDEIIKTLNKIGGLGNKYSRNMMMDIGHPEFMDSSFAFDSRFVEFLTRLTGRGPTYSIKSRNRITEVSLREIARNAGITCWQMDRLIFQFGNLEQEAAAQ